MSASNPHVFSSRRIFFMCMVEAGIVDVGAAVEGTEHFFGQNNSVATQGLMPRPLHEGSHVDWPTGLPEQAAPQSDLSCLEDYRPCAGGLSGVNAIGTHVRDLINSVLTR